jgi:hypothetical protein
MYYVEMFNLYPNDSWAWVESCECWDDAQRSLARWRDVFPDSRFRARRKG